MTREELLRILEFSNNLREISDNKTKLSVSDARWNILSYAMERHLEGRMLTVTSAAMASKVPYATAMRRIEELLAEGMLIKRPRSKTGKSYSLHPSKALIAEYETYAVEMKSMVGRTFGTSDEAGGTPDYYFGGSYLNSRILSYPNSMRQPVGFDHPFRILCSEDPTFKVLQESSRTLKELCGTNFEIVCLPLHALYAEIEKNAQAAVSKFDLIACDLPWVGELASNGVISPLDDFIAEHNYNGYDFHEAAWRGAQWGGKQYGVPIQPTVEMLFCRHDLFEAAELALPATMDEVLHAAKALHRTQSNLSGIVMNYGPGLPVAHTFIQTMADFGQPIIDLDSLGDDFNAVDIGSKNYRPMIDTEAGRQTAEFLLELLPYAHPESLKCAWDRRVALFTKGEAAMTYGWSVRAASFEKNQSTEAHGKVSFLVHPAMQGRKRVSPIGGFFLAVPSNLAAGRLQAAWKVTEYFARPEMMKWYVQKGSLTSPRYSTSSDPEVQHESTIIKEIDRIQRQGGIQIWPRPAIPQFNRITEILGEEIHMMLLGASTSDHALKTAQQRIDKLMRDAGCY